MVTLCDIVEVLDIMGPMDFEKDDGIYPDYDDRGSSTIFAGLTYIVETIPGKFHTRVSVKDEQQRVEIYWGNAPLPQTEVDAVNALYEQGPRECIDEQSDTSPHLKAASLLAWEEGRIHIENTPSKGYHVKTTVELPYPVHLRHEPHVHRELHPMDLARQELPPSP